MASSCIQLILLTFKSYPLVIQERRLRILPKYFLRHFEKSPSPLPLLDRRFTVYLSIFHPHYCIDVWSIQFLVSYNNYHTMGTHNELEKTKST